MTTKTTAPALTEDGVRELSRRHAEPAWLLQRRLNAWRAFEAMAMPDPLAEEWRRTDLSRFDLDEALAASGAAIAEVEAQDLPAGVIVADLHAAARDHESLVQEHLHTLVLPTEWKLGALQAAAWQEGALIYVPRGVEVTLPLGLTRRQMGAPLLSHLLIVAEAGSSVTVIQESTGGAPSGSSLVSGAAEVFCGPDTRVRFVDVQDFGTDGVSAFTTVRACVERGAEFSASLVGLGGLIAKTKLEASLVGEGARAELIGLSYGTGRQHFDYVTLQDHLAPRTSSDLLFKAALTDQSSEVWNGTVRIRKGAGQSEANQTSRNLLLSKRAKAAPIPVLEIEAYDVLRCSHGATAGPLDEEQLFYLESRGIPAAEAERLLVDAFFQEVLDRIPVDALREKVAATLLSRLAADR